MPQEQMPERTHITTAESLHPFECGGACAKCKEQDMLNDWHGGDAELEKYRDPRLSALAERVKEAEIDAEKCHRLMMEADSDRVEAERRANSLAERVERAEALLKELTESTPCTQCSDRGYYEWWDGVERHDPEQVQCECSTDSCSRFSVLSRISAFTQEKQP